jgi:hypothetical protein
LESNKTYVTVEGDQEAVDAAVLLLRTLLDENSVCEKVSTRGREGNSHIPAIIGKQGAVIKKLRESTGAAIDLVSTTTTHISCAQCVFIYLDIHI